MKTCGKCMKEKEDDCFPYKNKAKGIRNSVCKICHKEYTKTHYLQNKSAYIDRAKGNNPEYVARNRKLMFEYLESKECVDCGEKDLVTLDFDHTDPATKKANVSRMVSSGSSWEAILKEINKCDVVCSNCHRRRTARRNGWYKLNMAP